jgi:hypothetical protein
MYVNADTIIILKECNTGRFNYGYPGFRSKITISSLNLRNYLSGGVWRVYTMTLVNPYFLN